MVRIASVFQTTQQHNNIVKRKNPFRSHLSKALENREKLIFLVFFFLRAKLFIIISFFCVQRHNWEKKSVFRSMLCFHFCVTKIVFNNKIQKKAHFPLYFIFLAWLCCLPYTPFQVYVYNFCFVLRLLVNKRTLTHSLDRKIIFPFFQ